MCKVLKVGEIGADGAVREKGLRDRVYRLMRRDDNYGMEVACVPPILAFIRKEFPNGVTS